MTADEGLVMPRREAVVVVVVQRWLMNSSDGRDAVEALAREQADRFLVGVGYTYAEPEAPLVLTKYEGVAYTLPHEPFEVQGVPPDCVLVRATFDTVQLPTTP